MQNISYNEKYLKKEILSQKRYTVTFACLLRVLFILREGPISLASHYLIRRNFSTPLLMIHTCL